MQLETLRQKTVQATCSRCRTKVGSRALLHLPADPDNCDICRIARIARSPYRAKADDLKDVAKEFGERIHPETVGPVRDSHAEFRFLLCCRDDAEGEVRVAPQIDKKSITVTPSCSKLYADVVMRVAMTWPDYGKEFEVRGCVSGILKQAQHRCGSPCTISPPYSCTG